MGQTAVTTRPAAPWDVTQAGKSATASAARAAGRYVMPPTEPLSSALYMPSGLPPGTFVWNEESSETTTSREFTAWPRSASMPGKALDVAVRTIGSRLAAENTR